MPKGCPIASLEERFLERTLKQDNDCILWIGGLTTNGYGQLRTKIWGTAYAHQWACHHWNSAPLPIPKGWCIKHSCDNKQCVNPEHLSYGTLQENIQEMIDRNPVACGRIPATDAELILLQEMLVDEVPRREMARRIGHSRHWIDRVIKDNF